MKSYHVMVTSYGYADIVAESEEEALAAVNSMDESDFAWNHDFSADDASIVDEEECEDEDDEECREFYVTVEKKQMDFFTVEAKDLDEAIKAVYEEIQNEQVDNPDWTYDFAICDEDGRTLVDWEQ